MKFQTNVRGDSMKMNATLSCSICGFETKKTVLLPFDCDTVVCPRCGEGNSLSIITIAENEAAYEKKPGLPGLDDLYRIRRL